MTTPSTPPDLDARTDAPPAAVAHAHAGARDSTVPTLFPASMTGLLAIFRPYLWAAPLLGGLMLLVHFWRVGYLPALSFAELGVVLGAFGLFVAVGVGVFLVLLLLPVAAILHWTAHSLLPAPPKASPDAAQRRRHSLSRQPLPLVDSDASPAKRRTFSARMRPGGFGMFWVASACAVVVVSIALFVIPPRLSPNWQVWPSAVSMWLGLLLILAVMLWMEWGIPALHLRKLRGTAGQFLLLFALNLLLWPLWLSMLAKFDAWPDTPWGWLLLASVALFLMPWAHWIWYATLRGPRRVTIEVRTVTSVFVLLYAGLGSPLLDGAASTYGFGMMRGADLVLTGRGCAIVAEALPGHRCEAVAGSGSAAAEAEPAAGPAAGPAATVPSGVTAAQVASATELRVHRLTDVDVLTRVGAEYVIAPPGGIDDRTLPRATLPAGEVLALVRRGAVF